jgi:hypothetical protein
VLARLVVGVRVFVSGVLITLGGCQIGPGGGTDGTAPGDTVLRICTRLVTDCKLRDPVNGAALTLARCEENYGAFVLGSGCADAIESASCTALAQSSGNAYDACFPPCNSPTRACQGDALATCGPTSGRLAVVRCSAACKQQGFTRWVGECGVSYEGRRSSDGQPICWCE